jgi:hypothetical protein
MGTNLTQIGNHQIRFKDRTFEDIAEEIKTKLNGIKLINAEFLRTFALEWATGSHYEKQSILKIKTKHDWTYRP